MIFVGKDADAHRYLLTSYQNIVKKPCASGLVNSFPIAGAPFAHRHA
jgi:hypothetical protein